MAQAQQISPNQVKGLKESLEQLDSLVPIKKLGDNLELQSDGTLIVTGIPESSGESSGDTGTITEEDATKVGNLPDTTLYDVVSEALVSDTQIEYTIQAKDLKTGATSSKKIIVPVVTSEAIGLMSKADKTKLDGLLNVKSVDDSLTLNESGQLSVTVKPPKLNLLNSYESDPASDALYTAIYLNNKFDAVESETASKITQVQNNVNAQIGDIKAILDAIDVGNGGESEGGSVNLTELKERLVALNTGVGVQNGPIG